MEWVSAWWPSLPKGRLIERCARATVNQTNIEPLQSKAMLGTRLSGGVERISLFQVHRYIELNSEQVCMFVSVVPQLKLYIYIYIYPHLHRVQNYLPHTPTLGMLWSLSCREDYYAESNPPHMVLLTQTFCFCLSAVHIHHSHVIWAVCNWAEGRRQNL